ncbi:MAG TPA: bifunctional diaminohydroxyphosphoribosylaminopyrimidine deaminase/5-amino-6-(5-phosphoribosylamino)uracil reductase RibD [Peptococcaceae bacterium]|nr:bifunctional diaminohydroxyphosphoribosylaminopyrimidine deaminase/5-amino-6-(5-phosphoribosylamino)uracil reductase RibD [Peptococcaceae bacterium]
MNSTTQDRSFMERALELALKAAGRTSPNPMVGCVIVKNGQIVGEGYHAKAGTPHAEIHALHAAGTNARGADVYVTLEPCSHYGRTPPCTEALIQAGVKRVVIAVTDPNPLVNGRGLKKLQEAGIIVETGLLAEKALKINEFFFKAISQKIPFVLYKSALTLDGQTAVESGDSKWITSEEARHYVHKLRNIYDVIMVGSQTVINDDPLLTCRGIADGRDPVRLIVDGSLRTPLDAQAIKNSSSLCILATTLAADPEKIKVLKEKANVEVWQYPTKRYVPLTDLMRDIVAKGFNSVLLEGGGILAGKMLEEKLIDKIEFILAPKLAGLGSPPFSGLKLTKMSSALKVRDLEICQLGVDLKIAGYIEYCPTEI